MAHRLTGLNSIGNLFSRLGPFPTLLVTLSCALATGCANQPKIDTAAEKSALETPEPIPAPEPRIVYKNFEPETIYSLIVADLALDRGRYDIGLSNYVQQAHKTQDAAIAARATRIARYLGADQATLNTSLLWLDLEPQSMEARVVAANQLAQVGRLTEALEVASPLAGSEAESIFQTIAARASQSAKPQQEILLEAFSDLVAKNPQSVELKIAKGLLLLDTEQLQPALKIAQKLLVAYPDNVSAAHLESKVLQELDRADEAIARLESMLERNGSNQRLRLNYARLLADKDLDAARDQFRVLLSQSPDDSNYQFSMALINKELGESELARDLFTQLVDDPHRGPSAHYYLGELFLETGNEDQALSHFQQVSSGPDFLAALNKTADILIKRGELDALRERFVELREVYPNQEERLYLAEAEILARNQLLELAVQVLTEALTFHADNSNLLYARAMINEEQDKLAQMEKDLRAILEFDNENATALNALGYTLANRTTRYQEAYDLINQALSLRPDDPAIIDSMGWVQYRLGNYVEALARLREAMKAFPDHEVAAHLGEVLWVTGNNEEAKSVWREGLKLKPDSSVIRETLERLDAAL